MATRPRRASWATFVAVHIVVQLQTAEMAILVWCTWYTKPVQITHSVLIQHFYVKEQISRNLHCVVAELCCSELRCVELCYI